MQRTRIAGLLGVLLLAGAGCAGTGVVPPSSESDVARFAKAHVTISQFADLPSDGYWGPIGITSGPKHSLWVTDDVYSGENAVVQISTSGEQLNTFTYNLDTEYPDLGDLVEGPDGALWITDGLYDQILRMTTDGAFTSYSTQKYRSPLGIVKGPDGALWFTAIGYDGESDAIGRITTQGKVTEYAAAGYPRGIAVGSDGALWYTEAKANAVARITTKGKITVYTKGISAGAQLSYIAAGPDGALWFTEGKGGRIGRITTAGMVTEYSRGITPGEQPFGIAAGPDGALWFTEAENYENSKIGRITTTGKITEFSKGLIADGDPADITAGPDGNMWFVEEFIAKTGRATISR